MPPVYGLPDGKGFKEIPEWLKKVLNGEVYTKPQKPPKNNTRSKRKNKKPIKRLFIKT